MDILILSLLCFLVLLLLVRTLVEKDEDSTYKILIFSFPINLIMAVSFFMIFSHFDAGYGTNLFFSDDGLYFQEGVKILNSWLSAANYSPGGFNSGYQFLNAVLYYLFGVHYLIPVVFNVFLHQINSILFYKLGENYLKQTNFKMLFLYLFYPNFIFWSFINLKDTLLITAVLLSFLLWVYFKKYKKKRYIFWLALTLVLMLFLRFYLVGILAGVFVIDIISVLGFKRGKYWLLGVFVLSGGFVIYFSQSSNLFDVIMRNGIWHIFENSTNDNDLMQYMASRGPLGRVIIAMRFLLTPIPWKAIYGSLMSKGQVPGMFIYYFLLPDFFLGAIYILKSRSKELYYLLSYVLINVVLYSLTISLSEPRHRLIIIPFIFLIALYNRERLIIARYSRIIVYLLIFIGLFFVGFYT